MFTWLLSSSNFYIFSFQNWSFFHFMIMFCYFSIVAGSGRELDTVDCPKQDSISISKKEEKTASGGGTKPCRVRRASKHQHQRGGSEPEQKAEDQDRGTTPVKRLRKQVTHPKSSPSKLVCSLCPRKKLFTSPRSVLRHKQNAHNSQKDHTCRTCRKSFGSKSLLAQHKSDVHSHKFVCMECSLTFTRKHDLKRHVSSQHGQYNCPICKETVKGNKENHLKTRHVSFNPLPT